MPSKPTVIFDIDGTLADISERRKLIEGGKKDWKEFHNNYHTDVINKPVVDLYTALQDSCKFTMVIVTGRSSIYRAVTEAWLTWNNITYDNLYMRPEGDNRNDSIIKQEILDYLIQQDHNILFTVDDRQRVVDMWRRNDIVCLQCDYGDF